MELLQYIDKIVQSKDRVCLNFILALLHYDTMTVNFLFVSSPYSPQNIFSWKDPQIKKCDLWPSMMERKGVGQKNKSVFRYEDKS